MGVRRAVDMTISAAESSAAKSGRRVYTLGPLIHNPKVLKDLEKRGIRIMEEDSLNGSIEEAPENSMVIIRAHGVSPETEKKIADYGYEICDATCPHVKASQKKAQVFAEKGYGIFLAGEENHAEIIGIRGYAADHGNNASVYVVGNPAEAGVSAGELFRREPEANTALIAQTTISPEEYCAIGKEIKRFFPELTIENTICSAITARQEALRELCLTADALIIAGGKESANTRRLLSLALDMGKPAWIAEDPGDIPGEIARFKTVGLSAGASTPDDLIDEIEEALKKMADKSTEELD